MGRTRWPAALVAAALLAPALAEEPKAPAGAPAGGAAKEEPAPPAPEPVLETIRGLRVSLLVPPGDPPPEGRSLLLFLHSESGTGKETVQRLAPLLPRGFVLAGPWSKAGAWAAPEIETVKDIAKDLFARFRVPRERRHLAGLWSGASYLGGIAFEEDLGFRTCTWIDSGWGGGTVPRWAKEELNGMFLWGAQEGPSRVERYRKSVSMLADKVRLSVGRGEPQEGLGRGKRGEEPVFPERMLPFWGYFLECMEGRFEPARDLSFEWQDDLEGARTDMNLRKTGGFALVYSASPGKEEWERAKVLQNSVLFDFHVRHFADQLVPVRLERERAKELMAEAAVEATPAVIVFRKGGREILKAVSGEVTEKNLLPLLRAVALDQEMPR